MTTFAIIVGLVFLVGDIISIIHSIRTNNPPTMEQQLRARLRLVEARNYTLVEENRQLLRAVSKQGEYR